MKMAEFEENNTMKNGFTKLPNDVLEITCKVPLSGTQMRIIMAIWRYTYGFNRDKHELSAAFLAEAIQANKNHISKELRKLIALNIIQVEKKATFNTSRILSFNPNYREWLWLKGISVYKIDRLVEIDHSPEVQTAHYPEVQIDHQERKYLNKNINKDIVPFQKIIGLYNEICFSLPRALKLTDTRKKHISARWKEMPDLNKWMELFLTAQETPFLKGDNSRGWACDFDWLINEANQVKVFEGKYKGSAKQVNDAPQYQDCQALEIYFDQEMNTYAGIRTFEDKGILTKNEGLVIKLEDGSEFQLTIVRSR